MKTAARVRFPAVSENPPTTDRTIAISMAMPIVMPTQAQGPLTLVVSDASALTALERELRPGKPTSLPDLMTQLGHSKLETTQIYAAAVSERRRATVMAMEFGASGNSARANVEGDTRVSRA